MAGAERQSQSNTSTTARRASRAPSRQAVPVSVMRGSGCACGGGCPRCASSAASGAVSSAQAPHEREAHDLSARVVQMPEPSTAVSRLPPGADIPAPTLADVPAAVRSTLQSAGSPLDPATRDYMEPRLGHDLSGVRIHTDSGAADSAQSVGAHAYSAGNDIVFGEGRYEPHSDSGRRLLAHELVHVVQAGMAAGSHWGSGIVGQAAAEGAAPVPIQQPATPAQLSRFTGTPRAEWLIYADIDEVERQLADPTLNTDELRELQLRRDYLLEELSAVGMSVETSAPTSTPTPGPRERTTGARTTTTTTTEAHPRAEAATPDVHEYSGTELEAEIVRLRDELALLPADESSEERDTIVHRLTVLEASLLQRQALGQRSEQIAQVIAASPGDLQNRITMAFAAGFAAGALMEFRPAEARRFVDEINAHPFAFNGGIYVGITEGALVGLWDNIVGLAQLLLWTSPAYWTYRGAGELIEYLRDPAAYEAQAGQTLEQAQALMAGLGEFLVEVVRDPDFLVIHGEELGEVLGRRAAEWFNDDFMRRTPFEKGRTVGVLVGRILIEIALLFLGPEEWIARGAAAAGQVARVSARMERAVLAILERLPSLRRFLELRRAAGGGARVAEETVAGARTVERVVEGAGETGRVVESAAGTATDVERAVSAAPPPATVEGATGTARTAETAADVERAAGSGTPPPGAESAAARTVRELDDWERAMLREIAEDVRAHPDIDWADLGYADEQAVLDAVMRHPRREELLTDMSLQLDRRIAEAEARMTSSERIAEHIRTETGGGEPTIDVGDLSTIERPRGSERSGVLSGDIGEAAEVAGAGATRLPPTYARHLSAATRSELRQIFSEFGDDALRVFVDRLGLPPGGLRQVEIPVSSGVRRVDRLFLEGEEIVLREVKNYPRGILRGTPRITDELAKDLEILGRYSDARVDWHLTGRIGGDFLAELRAIETQLGGRFRVILGDNVTVIP